MSIDTLIVFDFSMTTMDKGEIRAQMKNQETRVIEHNGQYIDTDELTTKDALDGLVVALNYCLVRGHDNLVDEIEQFYLQLRAEEDDVHDMGCKSNRNIMNIHEAVRELEDELGIGPSDEFDEIGRHVSQLRD